jgi:transposase InsO family protein
MQTLKDLVLESPALRPIDYECGREVILAVDTSLIAVGFILLQIGDDGQRYPNRFGSISLTEVESRYSQAKLELYGLFRALRAVRVYTFGVTNLTVEVDAKYIKGMINNPDLQPNATINRWIAGILLFSFKLVHVPASKHAGVDGLSRRPPAEEDPEEHDDHEDWLDRSYSFSMEILNSRSHRIASAEQDFIHMPYTAPVARTSPCLPPLLAFLDITVAKHDDPPIPRSEDAKVMDKKMNDIRRFLESKEHPAELTEDQHAAFVATAARYFIFESNLWRREPHGRHQLVVPEHRRYRILKEAHDDLGHKGILTIRTRLLLRFWWPMIVDDIKWYNRTCHECQVRQTRKLHIPPTVPIPGGIYRKAHIDTMLMPKSGRFNRIVHARCALTGYPEWRMLRNENTDTLSAFVFEELLCRWGPITEIVTDNAPQFRKAVDLLATKYGIHPIRISPYNSQANGIVERRHWDVREAIMKSCDGDESRWHQAAHAVFWAERVTIQRSTGLSPYFMVHGCEPIFPFDLTEATFLVPLPGLNDFSTEAFIAWRARQLQKRQEDLEAIRDKVLKARYQSARDFERKFRESIKDYDFAPGSLVLVRNSKTEYELNRKTKPRYLGPMIVLRRTQGGSYLLAELDGSVSKLRYAAFRLLPYHPRSETRVSVTRITGMDDEHLDNLAEETVDEQEDEDIDFDIDA